MKLEMTPVGNDHASDHVIVLVAVILFASMKGIPLNGKDKAFFRLIRSVEKGCRGGTPAWESPPVLTVTCKPRSQITSTSCNLKIFGRRRLLDRKRSPDASWVEMSRWQALTPEQQKKLPPIAPDFVIEVRSPTDNLETFQEKMQEYMGSGVQLVWMFNPQDQQVKIYRQGRRRKCDRSQRQFLVKRFFQDLNYRFIHLLSKPVNRKRLK